ncbi:MAG: UDP-N-acetylmuramoyl-L-alanyl-D-glutamate--2,6-diaminopimelate ligase [Gemmatimonadetes bacterium]|nr:UDP-N-acetylmuramoyl-L-alanyl-D-glutamate--2,6-diaminopimelate ligase [Gemmatimonadota bacterium]
MKLSSIVGAMERRGLLVSKPAALPDITGITEDSRRVMPGMLFCAIEGSVQDGHGHLADALARGAAAALVTRPADLSIPQVVVNDSRRAVAIAAAEWYGNPAAEMTVVGVTGTSGKSTTVALIRHVLNERDDVAAIGTLGAFDGRGAELPEGSGLTTPSPVEIQATLAELKRRGTHAVALEASSHALDQRRLAGIGFSAGVFTNLSHEHLDYHADLSSYLGAKLRLAELIVDGGVTVVNGDDRAWRALAPAAWLRRVEYGESAEAQVRVSDIQLSANGSTFRISAGGESVPVALPLIGEFNVSNALAAAATAIGLGRKLRGIAARLGSAPQVPGRMERIVGEPFTVIRDYSHKPDALQRALKAVQPLTAGRVIVVFGAGGDRDRTKRPVMGKIAAKGADVAIVTSDNPRTEDPERIIDEIEEGMDGIAHVRLVDRREAIHRALAMARPGDCVMLAGKGHETYQVIGTEKVPFDERAIVLEALDRMRAA